MKLQRYMYKLGSRKFQVLILGVVLLFVSRQFTGDHMLWLMVAYIGGNVLQKYARK